MLKAEGRCASIIGEQIKQHPEWFPAPLKANDRRWQALAENNHFLSSNHLHNITEVAIHRLEQQLGKPYVWGHAA